MINGREVVFYPGWFVYRNNMKPAGGYLFDSNGNYGLIYVSIIKNRAHRSNPFPSTLSALLMVSSTSELTALIQIKLHRPKIPINLVARLRLIAWLDEHRQHLITLVFGNAARHCGSSLTVLFKKNLDPMKIIRHRIKRSIRCVSYLWPTYATATSHSTRWTLASLIYLSRGSSLQWSRTGTNASMCSMSGCYLKCSSLPFHFIIHMLVFLR